MEMALSGTILPSISTFANQKEKCWEYRWKDINSVVSNMDSTCLGRKDEEDLDKFLDLEFILANTAVSDSAPVSGTVAESYRLQETGASVYHHHQQQHTAMPQQPANYTSVPDMNSPPPPYNSLMAELLRSDVDTSFLPGNSPGIQGRFLISSTPFQTNQDLFPELPSIKVEPVSMDTYGPVMGLVPQSCTKIKHEGNVSCMMSYEQQPRLANSPQAAVGSMTPPLSPDDLRSSECHQPQICNSTSLTFPQSFHPHHRCAPGGFPHPHNGMQLSFPGAHHHHQFPVMFEEDAAMGMQQQTVAGQRVLLTPPSSPLEMGHQPKRGRRSWPRKRTATHTCHFHRPVGRLTPRSSTKCPSQDTHRREALPL
ncbi:LOW QUALITY PROTEIN: Krueppel-like factor 4 [Morone saxatilis]|uniref:LOW QUALITY PROTEIN: Krueppel-like factor 4 n=1 Tax=Morone saxatilis TaxID=34816 RepID=UPI0015E2232A|nr:LOW QUALITY PROTEIN: Krueppel-like factor 4 [Morone saxatilis]